MCLRAGAHIRASVCACVGGIHVSRTAAQVRVDLPDVQGRVAILQSYLRHLPAGPDVALGPLARALSGLAGADIANLVNQAAIKAAQGTGGAASISETQSPAQQPPQGFLPCPRDSVLLAHSQGPQHISGTDGCKVNPSLGTVFSFQNNKK